MATTWISPWNGNLVSIEELISEVALAAVSRLYVFASLALTEPTIAIEHDSVTIHSPKIDYGFFIYYPKELIEEMKQSFSTLLLSLKREYGIFYTEPDKKTPSGEHMGEMLRNFRTLERLIQTVAARKCWDSNRVLVLHGLLPSQFLSSLKNDLRQANIKYLIILPLNDELGSGAFKVVDIKRVNELVESLKAERPRVVEGLLDMEESYGPHTLVSDNPAWSM
jgi:hypothetical protein